MSRLSRVFCLFLLVTATAAAQPTISSLSNSTAARSSRLLIQGSDFGTVQGTGHVEIGGTVAPFTPWSDTLIAAYVPEAAATGTVNVQVFDSTGASSNTAVGAASAEFHPANRRDFFNTHRPLHSLRGV
jgi:uncharacterized protein (TIGR03437 family)